MRWPLRRHDAEPFRSKSIVVIVAACGCCALNECGNTTAYRNPLYFNDDGSPKAHAPAAPAPEHAVESAAPTTPPQQ